VMSVRSFVQVAGFGARESDTNRVRRFGVERVKSISADEIVVAASGNSGLCGGDSGSPALIRGSDGEVVVAGVLYKGSGSCVGVDYYVSAASISEWLADEIGQSVRTRPDDAVHSVLGRKGRCFDGMAVWTEDGGLAYAACSGTHPCGWDLAASGFRCVSAGSDPCSGAGDLGRCEDDIVEQCADGVIETRPCDACGWSCEYSAATGQAGCI
jgi:hypothetical protein